MLRAAALVAVLFLAGCASTGPAAEDAAAGAANDPLEPFNRAIFKVNDVLDRGFLRPVSRGYEYLTPDPVQRGIHNFFTNFDDINGALNAALQGEFGGALRNSGRFALNSTLGLAGFFDVASAFGIKPYRTDFGHTLAVWGIAQGPYIVLPLLGPRTARSGAGSLFDTVASVQWQLEDSASWVLMSLEVTDKRAALAEVEDLITGDRYLFVRDAYLQQREYFVGGEVAEDTFTGSEDDFEW